MARFARFTTVLALAAIVLAACGGEDYEFQGGNLQPVTTTPDFQLTDQYGESWTMSDQTGKIVLLYFGYTTCPDACPTTLSDWIEVKRLLGDQADNVEFVMVTVDPERDTVEKLNQYMAFFDPEFLGLTGDQETITSIEMDYGIMAVREEHPESATGYLMNHTTSFWVVDTENQLRLTFAHGTDPEIVAEDIEHLL
ncbi:MAG: SCO family protein [Thermomicrobiales bacterium]